MKPIKLSEGIYKLTANVEGLLFEGMWDMPRDAAVNSYIVKGEKTAIIDGFCDWDGVPEKLFELLDELSIDPGTIDYLVINHMEPDHSGWIRDFKKIRKDFEVVLTKKAAAMLEAYYGETQGVRIVKTGDSLDLGGGRVLEFHEAPNVHWPETMMTLEKDSMTLFSCDMFGAFGKLERVHFDDEMTGEDRVIFEEEGLRYFANVMATFASQVKKAIDVAENLNPAVIAPGHGLVWRSDPGEIIATYKRYVDYALNASGGEITLLWGSMYGRTEEMVRRVEALLDASGMVCHSLQLPQTTFGEVLTRVLASSGVIVAAPTYEYQMFPPVAMALEEIGRKKLCGRKAFSFGSYGWATGTERELEEIMTRYRMKWDFVPGYVFNGRASEEDFTTIEAGVKALVEKVRQEG
ncbi:MAG: MBL fold metallo-hydrolase [delta proteobacterium ML8_F1]|nr:MAG: MBL fold metallo-hydrolase [delta proteobacterium ML8_F1]